MKKKHSAQCCGCCLVLNVGEFALKIERAPAIPYKATKEVTYSCPNPNCIARMPKWSNIWKFEKVEISGNITPAEKTEMLTCFKFKSSYSNTTDPMIN